MSARPADELRVRCANGAACGAREENVLPWSKDAQRQLLVPPKNVSEPGIAFRSPLPIRLKPSRYHCREIDKGQLIGLETGFAADRWQVHLKSAVMFDDLTTADQTCPL